MLWSSAADVVCSPSTKESAGRLVEGWRNCGSIESCETSGDMLGSSWEEVLRFIVSLYWCLRVGRVFDQLLDSSRLCKQCVSKLLISLSLIC